MKKVLVTGAAGFIGAFLCKRSLEDGLHTFAKWYREYYGL